MPRSWDSSRNSTRATLRTLAFASLAACASLDILAQDEGSQRADDGQAQAKLPAAFATQQGFRSLFDGESLRGWVTEGGRYDGAARWTVEDGAITGREGPNQAGGLIYTAERFGNFVFRCEAQILEPFDSGIFLRMVPRAEGQKGPQVTLDARPGGEIGAIYADGYLQHNLVCAESPLRHDDWNEFVVSCIGHPFRVQVWMNGAPLVDYELPAERASEFATHGRIGLQVHGARDDPERCCVRFRGLMIRELPEFDARDFTCMVLGRLTPKADAPDGVWRAVFDPSDAQHWRADEGGVEDGAFVFAPGVHAVRAIEEFRGPFEMRFDIRGSSHDCLSLGWSTGAGEGHADWDFTTSLLCPHPPGMWHSCVVRRSATGELRLRIGERSVALVAPLPLPEGLFPTLALIRGPQSSSGETNSIPVEPIALRNAYWRPIAPSAANSR